MSMVLTSCQPVLTRILNDGARPELFHVYALGLQSSLTGRPLQIGDSERSWYVRVGAKVDEMINSNIIYPGLILGVSEYSIEPDEDSGIEDIVLGCVSVCGSAPVASESTLSWDFVAKALTHADDLPETPILQMLGPDLVNDGARMIRPFWEALLDPLPAGYAIIELLEWKIGSCDLGDEWLIVQRYRATGSNPCRLLGAPQPIGQGPVTVSKRTAPLQAKPPVANEELKMAPSELDFSSFEIGRAYGKLKTRTNELAFITGLLEAHQEPELERQLNRFRARKEKLEEKIQPPEGSSAWYRMLRLAAALAESSVSETSL